MADCDGHRRWLRGQADVIEGPIRCGPFVAHGRIGAGLETAAAAGNSPLTRTYVESGRRESNPRSQLGKLMFCR